MLLCVYEFSKIRRSEGLNFLMGVTEIHLRVYREAVWHFESKERLGKVRVNFVKECTTYSFVRWLFVKGDEVDQCL
jgi:hypothetical protein